MTGIVIHKTYNVIHYSFTYNTSTYVYGELVQLKPYHLTFVIFTQPTIGSPDITLEYSTVSMNMILSWTRAIWI